MLRPRGCDRPKPIKELGEGAGEWGLPELRAGPADCSSPSTPTPAFKTCSFPLMGKYSRGLRSRVYDGNKMLQGTKWEGLWGLLFFQGQALISDL